MSPCFPANKSILAPRTVLDLLRVVDEWNELKEQTRRVLKANVRTAGYIAAAAAARLNGRCDALQRDDVVLAAVPADPAFLNKHLYAFPAPLFGTKKSCLHLSISGLRRVMRRADLIAGYVVSTQLPTDSEWRLLLDRLADKYCQTALSTFAIWAHQEAVGPADVSAETLQAFEEHIRTRTIHSEVPRLIQGVCKAWPKAAKLLGQAATLVKPTRRHSYTYRLEDFPASFQADAGVFKAGMTGSERKGPFREAGHKPLRPSTIRTRMYGIQQAATAFVHTGRDITSLISLADLLEIKAVKDILGFYWNRDQDALIALRLQPGESVSHHYKQGETAQTESIGATLMKIGKQHCQLDRKDPEAFRRLREAVQDVRPKPQTQLSAKNRDRLRQFDNPVTRAKLLHLPGHLKQLADSEHLRPREAARLARLAVTIEILLHIPLRNSNLTTLKLGTHLRYGHGGLIRHLVLQHHETKNSYDGEWPVGLELAMILDWYIKRHRPLLNLAGEDWLFPAGFGADGPISCPAMYQQIVRAVAENVGALVNPHFFRCLCARLILERSPDALEDVRLMIGDKSLQVVLAHYAASQPTHAAARTDATLRKLRAESIHHIAEIKKPRARRAQ